MTYTNEEYIAVIAIIIIGNNNHHIFQEEESEKGNENRRNSIKHTPHKVIIIFFVSNCFESFGVEWMAGGGEGTNKRMTVNVGQALLKNPIA